jgi:quercetin dioxygenase-like cupin family protein
VKVSRGREPRKSNRAGEHFTGGVWQDTLLDSSEQGARVYSVFFEPGGRTYWHAHEGGQVLYVTSGEGRVGTASGVETVRSGDVVHAPPGEEHWHGAGPDSFLMHVAVSLGATRWGAEVSGREYGDSLDL